MHKVNSGVSSTLVLQRYTVLMQSATVTQASASTAAKYFVRASVVIPVELRQPGASSLVRPAVLTLRGWKLTQGKLSKVDAPLKETIPQLGFVAEPICNSLRCIHPL